MNNFEQANTSSVFEYHSIMRQYVYDTNRVQMISNSHKQTINNLAKQLFNNKQLQSEIDELSTKQNKCIWWFGYNLGSIDANAVLFPRILKAQDRTQPRMPDFQHGYIAGMLHNDIENAIASMHDVVTVKKQKLDNFSWTGLGIRLEDVQETSLKKLVCALLMCDLQSRRTALELCGRYYDKSAKVPRFVRDMLFEIHCDIFSSSGIDFYNWKNLLIKSMKEYPPSAEMVSTLLQIALKCELKYFVDDEWHSILLVMLEQNKKSTWESILNLIQKKGEYNKNEIFASGS